MLSFLFYIGNDFYKQISRKQKNLAKMIKTICRLIFTLLLLLTTYSTTSVLGAEKDEPVLDVMGTVVDHDYLKVPNFINGGKIYLPRILIWEDGFGKKHLNIFSSTKKL